MDQQTLFKQMIEFQKGTFDNSFNAMCKLQEQSEEIIKAFINQAAWMPDEGKKAVTDWIEAYRKGQSQLKDMVDASFEKVQEFINSPQGKSEE